MASEEKIISDIKKYMDDHGGLYLFWYIGITENARRKLFVEDGVNEKNDYWIYMAADTNTIAKRVVKHFTKYLQTKRRPGSGDTEDKIVYAYKRKYKTP